MCPNPDLEIPVLRKDGSRIWAEISRRPIYDRNEVPIGLRISIHNISRRKIMEDTLEASVKQLKELNNSKDKFLAILAHDLRSPLSGIVGLTSYIVSEYKDLTRDEIYTYSASINKSSIQIFSLLIELLEWIKAEHGLVQFKPQMIQLSDAVDESFSRIIELANEKSLHIINEVDQTIKAIGDKNMVNTILRNLLSNAIKFTPIGGKIFIRSNILKNKHVQVSIEDTGMGMGKDLIRELFHIDSLNHRNSINGEHSHGLGLLICKEFVGKHNGKIWAESIEGKGSRIFFTLPNPSLDEEKNVECRNNRKVQSSIDSHGLKIMIAEDDKTSSLILAKQLQKVSREIIFVATGAEAVEYCRNHPDIDLILMDIGMPCTSGNEATREIRKFNRKVVIIAQSAGYLPSEKGRPEETIYNEFISKPIDYTLLTKLIYRNFKIDQSNTE